MKKRNGIVRYAGILATAAVIVLMAGLAGSAQTAYAAEDIEEISPEESYDGEEELSFEESVAVEEVVPAAENDVTEEAVFFTCHAHQSESADRGPGDHRSPRCRAHNLHRHPEQEHGQSVCG